jgi:hypothetical protein
MLAGIQKVESDIDIKRREEKEANRVSRAIADLRKVMEFTS